jgi:hypothetical protein
VRHLPGTDIRRPNRVCAQLHEHTQRRDADVPPQLLRRVQRHRFEKESGKVLIYDVNMESYRFENLRATVTLCRRNSHLRDHLDDTLVDGFDVVFECALRSTPVTKRTSIIC